MNKIYYTQHSIYSDPGEYTHLYHDFPMDVRFICDCIHHLFLHYADLDLFGVTVASKKYDELNYHYLTQIIQTILSYDNSSLIKPRAPERRAMGICRDSSLLLCSILRFFGIPARLRSGYVNYFIPGLFLDGLVVEYYDSFLNRWRLVDTRTSQKQIDHYKLTIDFDLSDLPSDKFISASRAWKMCNDKSVNPLSFGSRQHRGLSVVRNRLIQDLALLNKQELLVWDVWGAMFESVEQNIGLMNTLSDILLCDENNLTEIVSFYEGNLSLKVPERVLVDSPFCDSTLFKFL